MFTWTTQARTDFYMYVDLRMNDDVIGCAWSTSAGAPGTYSGSNAVIIHCTSGSRVYTVCSRNGGCRSFDGDRNVQSFSGFLLFRED